MRKIIRLVVIFGTWALLLGTLGGCQTFLAERMVLTPNFRRATPAEATPGDPMLEWMGVDDRLWIPVGPPNAMLATWIVNPVGPETPRGTILVLHGINGGPLSMYGKAKALAEHGYRAVLVALRGNGESTGPYRTFGVVEKQDLSQVIDALAARDLIAGQIGVCGMSYGGAMALQLAGHDSRIKAVVTVGAFSDTRAIAAHFLHCVPITGWFMSDTDCQAVVNLAGQRAGFDPDQASPVQAIAKTEAPVLLIHGTWDMIVPYRQAEELYAHAGPQAEFVALPMTGHIGSWLDLDGRVAARTNAWFDQWLR